VPLFLVSSVSKKKNKYIDVRYTDTDIQAVLLNRGLFYSVVDHSKIVRL
jgi:hypothetical protein